MPEKARQLGESPVKLNFAEKVSAQSLQHAEPLVLLQFNRAEAPGCGRIQTPPNALGYFMRNCYAFDSRKPFTRETEGVGFEPTVGFPTLDFESSALNRTQPPFQPLDIVRVISGRAIVVA
jgi:hypothetical protein